MYHHSQADATWCSLSYFMSSLDRLFDPYYTPTEEDILHTRARTSGVTETNFQMPDYEIVIIDVGGCRSERRKWMHQFSDVTIILFVVNLSGYDQCLLEDRHAVRHVPHDLTELIAQSSAIRTR
jgi:guanine nucleotide-binding protein subunit alpha